MSDSPTPHKNTRHYVRQSELTEALLRGYAKDGLTTRQVAEIHGMSAPWVNYICNAKCWPQVKLRRSRRQTPAAIAEAPETLGAKARAADLAAVIRDLTAKGWDVYAPILPLPGRPELLIAKGTTLRSVAIFTGKPSSLHPDHTAIATVDHEIYYRPALR